VKPQFAALGLALVAAAAVAATAFADAPVGAPVASAAPATQEAQAAVALVEQGAAFLRARGKAELIRRVNARDPLFRRGGLTLHMVDASTGVTLADPVHPSLVGLDLLDVPDAVGRAYRRDIVALAAGRGQGWVEHTYKNPADGRVEAWSDYILRVGDAVLVSGIARDHR
jgi:signal transduction histidine kinase